jgi:hypothetical protein
MRRTTILGPLLLLSALLACKKEEAEKEPAPTAAAPVPSPVVPPEPTPAPRPSAEESPSAGGIPTEGNSKPPTVAEWNAVGEITVRHSTPLGCETKLVREWLRVSCRTNEHSKYTIVGVKLTGGKDSGGIPPFEKKGVASIVTRVKKGMTAEYTFDWGSFTRKLSVAWPNGAPRPSIDFDEPPPS